MVTTDNEDPEHGRVPCATVAVHTLGCKLNQAESESLARQFIDAGFALVSPDDNPDVYVLNTCTVTHIADRKSRHHLRSFRKRNRGSVVVALGCYAERGTPELARMEGVDLVLGNSDKGRLVRIVTERIGSKTGHPSGNGHARSFGLFRTRSMVKVQEGCSRGCSYCIVPQVRGREISVPSDEVLREVRARCDEGCKEIVLTGTRVGAYDRPGGLEGLVRRILEETSVPRIRLSSLQPHELTESLLDLCARNSRICRHIHLALQSGSDSILRLMNRPYSTEDFEAAVSKSRDAMPDVAVTTDMIVGFPGETEDQFNESYRFCERMGFARLHVFPYSARAGTPAAAMPGRVPDAVKKGRLQRMLGLAESSAGQFRRRFEGKRMTVLWEETKGQSVWTGHTGNYIQVFTRSNRPLGNCITDVRLGPECDGGLWGDVPAADELACLPSKGA